MKYLVALSLALTATGANAQDPSFYRCQNKPVRVAIEAMPLKKALAAFTKATRCPVSIDTGKVGDMDAGDVTTTVVSGRFRPAEALRLMLRNTPLKSTTIKGGYSITR